MDINGQYLPIQSLDLEAESKITFNLYVNLPLNQRYILYRRAGGKIESSKLEHFSASNMSLFYIEKDDYKEFVKYVANRMQQLITQDDTLQSRKMAANAAKAILGSTLTQTDVAIAQALMGNLRDITEKIIEDVLVSSQSVHRKMFHRLIQLAEKGSDYQKHPVNVASLAILITFGIGYNRPQLLSDMAMAALLHDIGLSKIPPKIAQHSHDVLKLSIAEREQIYRHPEFAIEILKEKNVSVSEISKMIILQHHEEFNGNGYPKALRGYHVNELSQILRVADDIDMLFADFYSSSGNLKLRVMELLNHMATQKVISPGLLMRIRQVIF